MTGGRRAAAGVMTSGAALMIVGTLLTWVRSGGARRNSYDLFRLVGRLGFAPGRPGGDGAALVAADAVAGAVGRRRRVVGVATPRRGARARSPAPTAVASPSPCSLRPTVGWCTIGPGPVVTAIGAAILVGRLDRPVRQRSIH